MLQLTRGDVELLRAPWACDAVTASTAGSVPAPGAAAAAGACPARDGATPHPSALVAKPEPWGMRFPPPLHPGHPSHSSTCWWGSHREICRD